MVYLILWALGMQSEVVFVCVCVCGGRTWRERGRFFVYLVFVRKVRYVIYDALTGV